MRSALGVLLLAVLSAPVPAAADVGACVAAAERAQPLRRTGELQRARSQLIDCSAASCPRAVRSDCARWLTEVESALPTVMLQARDAGGTDIIDASVAVDSAVHRRTLDGLPLTLDPGAHVFRFEAPGRDPVEQTLVVREGEKNRVVAAVLARRVDSGKPTLAVTPVPVEPPPRASSGPPASAFLVGGAGLLAIGGGVFLWARGVSERNDLREQCASATSCVQGDIDAARSKLIVGDILVGAGLVAIAAGLWLALRAGPPPVKVAGAVLAF